MLLILSSVICPGCSQTLNLASTWPARPVVINGKYTDFGDATAYYDERQKVTLNLYNDNDYVYICLISRNREFESRLMESGLMVWFGPDPGKAKTLGIRFPIGMKAMGMSLEDGVNRPRGRQGDDAQAGTEDEKTREKERAKERDLEKRLDALVGLQDELEIASGPGPAKEGRTKLSLEAAAKQGIEATLGRQNGYFVYELKVPLEKNDRYQYGIGVKQGMPLALSMEMAPMSGPGMPGKGNGPDKPEKEGGKPQERDDEMPVAGGFASDSLQLQATIALAPPSETRQ